MAKRYYYESTIPQFLNQSPEEIIGVLTNASEFNVDLTQRQAWNTQIKILKSALFDLEGCLLFEYSIPRMGRRIDVIAIIRNVIFVLEFKAGESQYLATYLDQVLDYCLDLKNFHQTSHRPLLAPILIATGAKKSAYSIELTPHNDNLLFPIKTNGNNIRSIIDDVLNTAIGEQIEYSKWKNGRYSPTPNIIEAALALYNNHSVVELTKTEAEATNLALTGKAISKIIEDSRTNHHKSICFVTGVPGAGKTLVGLDIATKNLDSKSKTGSVFLSGNGPLVAILREAITRDKVAREKEKGKTAKKGVVYSEVKSFVQNVHHFRDDNLVDNEPPFEHIAIFDEAQRAWNLQQTVNFMKVKKNQLNFSFSEPEFLISCLDRHPDWAVIVCLVGGGQEINTGEAGISEWIQAINRSFPDWRVYISSRITDVEYAAGNALQQFIRKDQLNTLDHLHLSVSLRSFRAEKLSNLVKCILDFETESAAALLKEIHGKYPIYLTRDIDVGRHWLKKMARGSERYGIVVSSQAQRLKPFAIDVKTQIDPVHWFLNGKDDVRSSYYLEDVATEFQVQGLELDWTCVTWDADLRYDNKTWDTYSFKGNKWQRIKNSERRQYLKNAYRVLLTRARQGMIIVVPEGNDEDHTRKKEFYDGTYEYLKNIGLNEAN